MNARRTPLTPFMPLFAALACGGVGVVNGWLAGRAQVAAQGYSELGFERSAYFLYRDAVRAGTHQGLLVGAWVAAAVGLGLWAARGDLAPARVANWPASRVWTAWMSALAALSTTAMLLIVEREREWVAAGDIGYALAAALGLAAVLECLGRYARAGAEPARQSTVVASLAALALLFPALTWLGRDVLSLGITRLPVAPCVAAFAGSTLIFSLAQRRARARLTGRDTGARPSPLLVAGVLGGVLTTLGLNAGTFEGLLGAPTLSAAQPVDVIVIGIDTLRADATSLYGSSLHGRDTTPNLRKLAERGVLFESAVSQAPWTMPSFGSILTGRYPHDHGGFSLSGALREREVTLAEALREAGYATRGVVSHSYLGAHHGFTQGFESYDDSNALGHRGVTSKAVTDLALGALGDTAGRPLFLFAHYFDAHYEYMDQPDWDWGDSYQGWLRNENDYENLLKNRQMLGEVENRWLVDLYEEEIAFVDREIGRLLDELERSGRLERSLIVVVADHGEEFLDHDSYGHTTTLWEEQLHVPLLIVPPGSTRAARVRGVVETRAIFGTVLDVLGLDFAPAARERNLLKRVDAGGTEVEDPDAKAFSILWLPDAQVAWGKRMRISALREGPWKLIRHYTWQRTLLFDLSKDPRELHDLSQSEPERTASMLGVLEAWTEEQQNRGAARTVTLDREQARKLKELGY